MDHADQYDRVKTLFRLVLVVPIAIVYEVLTADVTRTVYEQSVATVSTTSGGVVSGLFVATLLMIPFRRRYPRWWFDFALESRPFGVGRSTPSTEPSNVNASPRRPGSPKPRSGGHLCRRRCPHPTPQRDAGAEPHRDTCQNLEGFVIRDGSGAGETGPHQTGPLCGGDWQGPRGIGGFRFR